MLRASEAGNTPGRERTFSVRSQQMKLRRWSRTDNQRNTPIRRGGLPQNSKCRKVAIWESIIRKQTRYQHAEAETLGSSRRGTCQKYRQQLKGEMPSGFYSALPRPVPMSGLML